MARANRSQIILGIILIGIGLLFFFNTLGILPHINWFSLFQYWPLILIFIGLNLLLRRTKFWWLVPLLLVTTVLLIFINQPETIYYRDYDFDPPGFLSMTGYKKSYQEFYRELSGLKVDLSFGAGKLYLNNLHDEDLIYEAKLRYKRNEPEVDYTYLEDEKTGQLTIDRKDIKGVELPGVVDDWRLYLTRKVPLDIEINAGFGQFNLNLEDMNLKELVVNTGAGDLDIELGNYNANIFLNSGAAKVEIEVPEETGVEITSTGVLSKNNFLDEGLTSVGENRYQTPGFKKSKYKLYINIAASASKVELERR